MDDLLKPLHAESLTEVFVSRFERLILSGSLAIGQKLPAERDLARQLGVSRPVVHEGLRELAARGLVVMRPRAGAVVSDYRREGSLSLLGSLVNYGRGGMEPGLERSMLDMRLLFECETARLAARGRTAAHLEEFAALLAEEEAVDGEDAARVTELDFRFHHLVALAGGNVVYPLIINSFKPVYTNLSGQFFADPAMAAIVFGIHHELVEAITDQDEDRAVGIMQHMLEHGSNHLHAVLHEEETNE